jgi:hypothetical protein
MASEIAIYGQDVVSLNGVLITEGTEVETTLENNDVDVMTILKDWAGITPSPQKRVTRITSAVPVAGLEFAFEAKQRAREVVELTVQNIGDGTMVKTKGLIRNVSRKSGVGQAMTLSFEHHGQDSEFE